MDFVENLIFFVIMQSCENRFIFDKVITDYVMCCFLWTTVLYVVISVSAESTTVKTALISGELGGRSAQLGQLHRVLSTITASF